MGPCSSAHEDRNSRLPMVQRMANLRGRSASAGKRKMQSTKHAAAERLRMVKPSSRSQRESAKKVSSSAARVGAGSCGGGSLLCRGRRMGFEAKGLRAESWAKTPWGGGGATGAAAGRRAQGRESIVVGLVVWLLG